MAQSVRGFATDLLGALGKNEWRPMYQRLAQLYGKYGQKLELEIDSRARTISIRTTIEGRDQPLRLSINRYRFVHEDPSDYLILEGIEVSWPWLNVLLATSGLTSKRIALKGDDAAILRSALAPESSDAADD